MSKTIYSEISWIGHMRVSYLESSNVKNIVWISGPQPIEKKIYTMGNIFKERETSEAEENWDHVVFLGVLDLVKIFFWGFTCWALENPAEVSHTHIGWSLEDNRED